MNVLKAAAVTFLFLLSVVCAAAQNPVSWTGSGGGKVKAGEKFNAQITAQIEGGWYIYSITQGPGGPTPTRIAVADGQAFKAAGAVRGPSPKSKMDESFGMVTETYSGSARFTVPVAASADVPVGVNAVEITARYQACNSTICLPPKTVKVSVPVEIVSADATPAVAQTSPSPTPSPTASPKNANANINANVAAVTSDTNTNAANVGQPELSQADSSVAAAVEALDTPPSSNVNSSGTLDTGSSLIAFLWAAAIAGALSLLTPCVFPMVPITVSYFTNHSEGSRGRATVNAFIFAIGIILTFTVLGMLLALLFGAAGINKFAASPWVNILIAVLFITFALSLFGAFNLGLPPTLLTKLDSFSRGRESSKILGLLLMGLVFSVTTLTCTAPLIGGLLVLATQGDWVYPALGMLAFSAVFALPFFALALAPQLLAQLPRSGGWLNSVKVVMGFLEVAAAMKFVSNVDLVWKWNIFTREIVLATWVAVAVLIVLYLLGVFQFSHDGKDARVGAIRAMVSLAFLSLGVFLSTGLFGQNLGELESFLPPRMENTSPTVFAAEKNGEAGNGELTWINNDLDGALTKARAENKHVFIDFTGYTCTNCRWMEANMFTRPPVAEQLSKYVRVRLYTDGEGEVYEKQQSMQQTRFGTVALPLYALVTADGRTLTTFPGMTRDQNEFLTFLTLGS